MKYKKKNHKEVIFTEIAAWSLIIAMTYLVVKTFL